MVGRHPASLVLKNAAGPDSEQQYRHHEESESTDARHQVGHSENASGADQDASVTKRGAISSIRSSPTPSSTSRRPAPGFPVIKPARSARNPGVIGTKASVRINQNPRRARTDS